MACMRRPALLGRCRPSRASRAGAASVTLRGRPRARSGERLVARRQRRAGRWPTRWTSASCSTRQRKLLSIGYRVADGTLDPSCYDLLASEARLASFFAIAKGDVAGAPLVPARPAGHAVGNGAALISWSGSMFEYLMPSLVMRAPAGSLLEQTSRLIVQRQIELRRALGMPWGISESAYNARDLELTYQYSNFGVPGLGLKRGLSEDVVVAPYATALAAMVDPAGRRANFARLAALGARRAATASTRPSTSRAVALPEGDAFAIVRAYMAHHQGMTIVAIANVLLDGIMRDALPRRADGPGDRAAAAGAHAARRLGGPPARRGGHAPRRGSTTCRCRRCGACARAARRRRRRRTCSPTAAMR